MKIVLIIGGVLLATVLLFCGGWLLLVGFSEREVTRIDPVEVESDMEIDTTATEDRAASDAAPFTTATDPEAPVTERAEGIDTDPTQ